ncbi:MAG: tetratricopeptide repeat protein [Hyphomicrobiales bacterium]
MLAAVLGTCLSISCLTTAQASSDHATLDAELHKVELAWEHVKFQEDGAPQQFDDMAAIAKQAAEIAVRYPGRAEPLIWEGIATSEEAGLASMLHAMTYAKEAKQILERADGIDPSALDAGAPTCLGVLYYRVPGFPVGFGNTDKAREMLERAVAMAPDGMDANYFYADFLMSQKEYIAAEKVLKHALSLPIRQDRPIWDQSRRAVMRALLSKAQARAS